MSVNSLLEQFITEGREFLQAISVSLMALEENPGDQELMTELFRHVHTLKGNSGLFDFPAMTRVLHAGEDLMDSVRHGRVQFNVSIADALLDAMDFVSHLLDEVDAAGSLDSSNDAQALALSHMLRALLPAATVAVVTSDALVAEPVPTQLSVRDRLCAIVPSVQAQLLKVSEDTRREMFLWAKKGQPLIWVHYQPEAECFFKGEDPFFLAMQTPGFSVAGIHNRTPWPALEQLDAYRCELQFGGISSASRAELEDYFRYVPEQVELIELPALLMVLPSGDENGGPVYEDFVVEALNLLERGDVAGLRRVTSSLLEFSSPALWLSSALRWLLVLLEEPPAELFVLRALIQSVQSLTPPDWLQFLQNHELSVGAVATEFGASAEETPPEDPILELAPARRKALQALLQAQGSILALPVDAGFEGRMRAATTTLLGCTKTVGLDSERDLLEQASSTAREQKNPAPMQAWVARFAHRCGIAMPATVVPNALQTLSPVAHPVTPVQAAAVVVPTEPVVVVVPTAAVPEPVPPPASTPVVPVVHEAAPPVALVAEVIAPSVVAPAPAESAALQDEHVAARRNSKPEDTHAQSAKTLRVDQVKIDRLMNLIGEMVVAKNALPYLANRAENQYGVRDLSREIKVQYSVINRIAEEMQDAIMQVRMMPVSFVFQRFPRLVRDLSNKLGKEVQLVLEGEETEADKNIVEALADPLIHIVRNSLDHGLELPEVRRANGKPEKGRLQISARQESDHVTIEITDDGRGIDATVIKRKAYQNGLISEERLEQISDQEAINLVFLPGFSTAETVTDLSGRGVGMDVVRNAIQKVGGTLQLNSVLGQGTRLRLSLPLSMAVTNVMIIESAQQIFGFPMDVVVETVRLPRQRIKYFKQHATTVLRDKVIPLFSLNTLLALDTPQVANDQNELALLVLRMGQEQVGLLVDAFRETTDIILKPLPGVLSGLHGYAGSALLGDGSVLMVLDHKELF